MQLKTLLRSQARDDDAAGTQEATYASWREASDGVDEAYRKLAAARRGQRRLAHAAYLTALDHEEDAARAYQELVERPRGVRRREGRTR
jgi:hypothetical protein